jgi:hypothetical protein
MYWPYRNRDVGHTGAADENWLPNGIWEEIRRTTKSITGSIRWGNCARDIPNAPSVGRTQLWIIIEGQRRRRLQCHFLAACDVSCNGQRLGCMPHQTPSCRHCRLVRYPRNLSARYFEFWESTTVYCVFLKYAGMFWYSSKSPCLCCFGGLPGDLRSTIASTFEDEKLLPLLPSTTGCWSRQCFCFRRFKLYHLRLTLGQTNTSIYADVTGPNSSSSHALPRIRCSRP